MVAIPHFLPNNCLFRLQARHSQKEPTSRIWNGILSGQADSSCTVANSPGAGPDTRDIQRVGSEWWCEYTRDVLFIALASSSGHVFTFTAPDGRVYKWICSYDTLVVMEVSTCRIRFGKHSPVNWRVSFCVNPQAEPSPHSIPHRYR